MEPRENVPAECGEIANSADSERGSTASMTLEGIDAFVLSERERDIEGAVLRKLRAHLLSIYQWLPDGKPLTKELLLAWRADMESRGYSSFTVLNYVKALNRYLDFMGLSEIRFNRGHPKDIKDQEFGYLTAKEPTLERYRKDVVWRCECRCGKTVFVPTTRLITGNTLSCGCLNLAYLTDSNKYIDGTSLRQSLEDRTESTRTSSGYTGVTRRRGKWSASITYKKKRYQLGCYTRLEDAAKARAAGKELVLEDAERLLEVYESLHAADEPKPRKAQYKRVAAVPEASAEHNAVPTVARSNNTSGHPGVFRKRDKWAARITFKKKTYHLGHFDDIDSAIEARESAERLLARSYEEFLKKYG